MAWYHIVWDWLTHTALGDLLVLALGGLAIRLCRQPVWRLRLIALTLAGCGLVACLNQLPGIPTWSAGWLSPRVASPEQRVSPVETATGFMPVASISGEPALRPEISRTPIASAASDSSATASHGDPASSGRTEASRALDLMALARALSWRSTIALAYASIAFVLFAWWLLGQCLLLRLYLTAKPAPEAVVDLFREVAGPAGDRVRLLQSDRVELPFTFTWWRPFILVPADFDCQVDAAMVRFALAHEWSHVERRDAWVWNLACLVELVAFDQPLFWWVRHQLRLCQDYLADARAAEQAPEAEDMRPIS